MLNPWRLRLLGLLDSLGTIRAVAETLHLSPSTVSQQLAVLEAETHSQLLARAGRRVRLTRTGVALARRGREILDRMAEAEAELRALNDEPIGTVRLGAFQSAIHPLAVPTAARLADSHPHLHVELIESEPHESGSALRTGELDVIVTTTDYVEFPWDRDLEIIPLGTDPVVLVLPKGHPLANRRVVDLAACAAETWACDRPGSYLAELTARLCREAGFAPRVACRFSNYLLAVQHVEAGRSVTLLPAMAVAPNYAVVTRELTTPVHRNVAIVVRRGTAPRAAVDAVVGALLDHPEIPGLSVPASGGD
ncbi:DNA-binding transcriptional LysR family regulator [Tamaricihabitans halophyticus]|uniref:DNA-binding transcriptional LysR family regulator n=1 Tax=Tamaricihabitans halophyticus TaxID=1262583 RepID=A0A4V2SUQ6_9PSEU|nr:LysR substrate-binding domain-containing protein [Tamaricihabitans halophyticus]TCP55026.1 DNA-binding transcriptional LysR family regulator [Tamaricihabitans halophyticus]